MEDMSTMRTPEQVKVFQASETARQAIICMGEFESHGGKLPPSKPEYTIVRDYLLTVLCINNGSRSGTLANMTLDEFRNAQEEDGCFVAKVKNHKTFTTHGPVHLLFSPTLHTYVKLYIANFRNKLGNVSTEGNAPVFLSWSKTKMLSSRVGAQIGSCWGKVFGKEAASGGATAFRKAAVSAVHETSKELRDDLANLMVHNQSTADRYYLLKNKGKAAVRTSKELAKIMRKTSGGKDGETSGTSKDEKSTETNNSPSRHKWTAEEVDVLNNLFASHIKEKSISLDEVKEMIIEQPLLCDIPAIKVRDKIRSYFKTTVEAPETSNARSVLPPVETESQNERMRRFGLYVPEEDTTTAKKSIEKNDKDDNSDKDNSEYTPSLISPTTVSTTTTTQLLSNQDTTLFKKAFYELIHSSVQISKEAVYSQLENEPKLAKLSDQFTFRQLADKVRTERRRISRENERRKKRSKVI